MTLALAASAVYAWMAANPWFVLGLVGLGVNLGNALRSSKRPAVSFLGKLLVAILDRSSVLVPKDSPGTLKMPVAASKPYTNGVKPHA